MNLNASDYFYDSTDGLRLYCRIYPAPRSGGLPVLCLPGLTRNSRDFAALAAHLTPQREVFTADLRGRGRSAWDPDPSHYQLPTYVEDVVVAAGFTRHTPRGGGGNVARRIDGYGDGGNAA